MKFPQPYLEFLNSPQWLLKRAGILKRDGYRCRECQRQGTKGNPLEVDHECYPPWNSPVEAYINQPDSELRTLCHKCHNEKTSDDRKRRSIARELMRQVS